MLLNDENEDWWYVTTPDKKAEGYVPSTFIRYVDDIVNEIGDATREEELEDIEEDAEEEEEDYEGEEEYEEEEYETEEEDDEEDGMTDDLIDVIKQQKLAQLRRRSSLKQPKGVKLIAPDPVKGIESLPNGFRSSTLAKNAEAGTSNNSN